MDITEILEIDDLSPKEVANVIARHGACYEEFLDFAGDKEQYTGYELFSWLGY